MMTDVTSGCRLHYHIDKYISDSGEKIIVVVHLLCLESPCVVGNFQCMTLWITNKLQVKRNCS